MSGRCSCKRAYTVPSSAQKTYIFFVCIYIYIYILYIQLRNFVVLCARVPWSLKSVKSLKSLRLVPHPILIKLLSRPWSGSYASWYGRRRGSRDGKSEYAPRSNGVARSAVLGIGGFVRIGGTVIKVQSWRRHGQRRAYFGWQKSSGARHAARMMGHSGI